MATPSAPTPAARKATAPQQAILAELVDIARLQAEAGLADMLRRMVSALLDLTAAGPDPRAVMRRVKSGNLLKDNSYAFSHLAVEAIAAALRDEVERLAPSSQRAPAAQAELSLVPLEQIDQQMALSSVSRPFDLQYSEQLATLGVRLGLLLGRELVRAQHNPFRPEIFLAALGQAWSEFEPDPEAHGIITPLLRPGVMFDLAPLYEALIEELKSARKGRDDDTRFSKTDDRASLKAERARRDASLSQQLRNLFDTRDPALDIPDIPNLPQGSGGWRPSTAAGFDVPAPAEAEPAAAATGAAPAGAAAQAGALARAGADGAPGHPGGVLGAASVSGGAAHMPGHPGVHMPLLDLLGRLGAGMSAGVGAGVGAGSGMPSSAHGGAETVADFGAGIGAIFGAGAGASAVAIDHGFAAHALPQGVPQGVLYLPRLRQSLPQGALSRGDETTLDLMTRIFETVLHDDAIPSDTRELISLLQFPVLKAALRDRSFFFEEAHPARRMLDLLSQAGWEMQGGEQDPVYRAMRSSVERVRDQEQPEFGAALAELEAGIAARDSAEQAAFAGPIAQATRQEKQAAAARSAERAVASRLAGEQLVQSVHGFLRERWKAALALAYTIEDSRPGAVDNATRTMDDLIWSVKPKATQEQRKALIARLPALLASLNKWLDATRWQDAERLQFFAELADCHASIVRAPIELSPERQLELAVEAAQQDALRRVAQEQEQLHAQEREEAQAGDDPAASLLGSLERGMRLELGADEGARKVRLAWVSPLRTLYIFSGAGRQEAFSLSAERLSAMLRDGTIRVVAAEGVVGRILSAAVGPGAVNDAAPEADAACSA